jgi:hypothetical protein
MPPRDKNGKYIFFLVWSLFLIASLHGVPCRVRKAYYSEYLLEAY